MMARVRVTIQSLDERYVAIPSTSTISGDFQAIYDEFLLTSLPLVLCPTVMAVVQVTIHPPGETEAAIPSTSGGPGDVSDYFRRVITLQATISGEVSRFKRFPMTFQTSLPLVLFSRYFLFHIPPLFSDDVGTVNGGNISSAVVEDNGSGKLLEFNIFVYYL
ncbi:unnamed protein product [Lactuca virosa]|uniref:Uncharacterized protein n=1 Tax=Lactuca virosa TaxID=75947 RepID=A0AAU9MUY0_9ASTR|nr:unnamed protein product [Lactuca virosa]